MDTVIIKDFRCFAGEHRVRLRPVTLLVGENSAGKTSFLAAARLAEQTGRTLSLNFNEPPFSLGAYDQIARFHGGQGARVKEFVLGQHIDLHNSVSIGVGNKTKAVETLATFQEQAAHPMIVEWGVSLIGESGARSVGLTARYHASTSASGDESSGGAGDEIEVAPLAPEHPGEAEETESAAADSDRWIVCVQTQGMPTATFSSRWEDLRFGPLSFFLTADQIRLRRPKTTPSRDRVMQHSKTLDALQHVLAVFRARHREALSAFPPIRSAPQRTYDPIQENPAAAGTNAPMVLGRLSVAVPEWRDALTHAISRFGEASGLFRAVSVEHKGNKGSDPFQIHVQIGSGAFNLMDVGYGVSQALPMLVEVLNAPDGKTFLLQQPEVHLHPRAQAEFGSLLCSLAHVHNQRFIVETHSDAIVDRVRMEVRKKGSVTNEDVAVLFFEREADTGHVTIHEIPLDEDGNFQDVPDAYRRFFLEEQDKLLFPGM
ncbi:MAG: DUF3696 domain-containing protein [Planctomycetes bacterium]|nr:DUF3696 domain-containing protein [Planctomycetota bacterium]